MRLAWQMREPRVERLLASMTREEFDRWFVAYHELRLDGSRETAAITAAIGNALGPVHAYLGLDWQPTTIEDQLPKIVFGDEDDPVDRPSDEPDWEALAARAWG